MARNSSHFERVNVEPECHYDEIIENSDDEAINKDNNPDEISTIPSKIEVASGDQVLRVWSSTASKHLAN